MSHRSAAVKVLLGLLFPVLSSFSALAQGALTNGFTHTATLSVGDLDVWQFTAKAGDGIFVKLGEAAAGSSLYPYLRVQGPDGSLLGENRGSAAAAVALRGTNNGTFTVTVANADDVVSGGNGTYRLTLAKTGTAVFVASYDEGGPMTNGAVYLATNGIAGLDLWTFNACPGDGILLQLAELSGGSAFNPELRLYAPDGEWLEASSGTTAAQISRTAPQAGNYLLIVGDTTAGYGTYQLTGTGISPGFKLCPPELNETNVVISGVGGPAGSHYVLLATTNLARPLNDWTPIRTNQFGVFGGFSETTALSPGATQEFFGVRTP